MKYFKTLKGYREYVLNNPKSYKISFKVDNRVYYVYRITDIKTYEYYYGSRIKRLEDIIEDFWSYCTSSKRKSLIKENKENYKIKILKVFNNPGDMIIYESYLHQYFDVKNHKRFFNKANQTPFGFNCTKDVGIKISKANKGKVSVRDLNNNKVHINTEEYHNNKSLYKHKSSGLVVCKNNAGKSVKVSTKEYYKKKYKRVNKGMTTGIDALNIKHFISTKEYYRNNFKHPNTGFTIFRKDNENVRVSTKAFRELNLKHPLKGYMNVYYKNKKIKILSKDYNKKKHKLCNNNNGEVSILNDNNEIIRINKEEYNQNKEKYRYCDTGNITVLNEENKKVRISTKEYKRNKERYRALCGNPGEKNGRAKVIEIKYLDGSTDTFKGTYRKYIQENKLSFLSISLYNNCYVGDPIYYTKRMMNNIKNKGLYEKYYGSKVIYKK